MKSTDFVVARDDLQHCKFIGTQLPDVLPDEALLIKIDRFAFTAPVGSTSGSARRGRVLLRCWTDG
jgi:hypothetical protein